MTTKHTPGPWYAARPNSANGWWIVSTDPDGDNCVDDSGDGGYEEANARLIAAAPDLLEALKAVTSDDCVHGAFDMARAAIAKAEGRS